LTDPQDGHPDARAVPHASQKATPASFSVPQLEQTTDVLRGEMKERGYNAPWTSSRTTDAMKGRVALDAWVAMGTIAATLRIEPSPV
jgi:hypothetical protein